MLGSQAAGTFGGHRVAVPPRFLIGGMSVDARRSGSVAVRRRACDEHAGFRCRVAGDGGVREDDVSRATYRSER